MPANKEDLFFVYCDIFESINVHLSSGLGISIGDILNNITIIDGIEEKMRVDAPRDIANFLKEIMEIIGKIREVYHTSSIKKKISEKELRKVREDVRDYIGKMERRIGKIEYLIELRKREERMILRNIVKELQGIKKMIKEFNDGLDAIHFIEWEAGLSKAKIKINPKNGRKFHLAKTKLFDLAIESPSNIAVSMGKEKVTISAHENFLLEFFPVPSMNHIAAKSITIGSEGIEIEGLKEGKKIHVFVKRKGQNINIEFSKDKEKDSWTYSL